MSRDKTTTYEDLGLHVGELVTSKQMQYGDSFSKAGEVLAILYPDGIPRYAYRDALAMVRVIDKLSRVAQRREDGTDRGGESPWQDIAGYAILSLKADLSRE